LTEVVGRCVSSLDKAGSNLQLNKEQVAMTATTQTYQVGKIKFLVTPVYPEKQGESIFEILLKLMKSEVEPT